MPVGALETMDRVALLQTVRIVIQLPADDDILAPEDWRRARELRARLMADPRVATVASFDNFSAERPPSRLKFYGIPRNVRTAYVTEDRGTVLFDVIPRDSVTPEAMTNRLWASGPRATLRSERPPEMAASRALTTSITDTGACCGAL